MQRVEANAPIEGVSVGEARDRLQQMLDAEPVHLDDDQYELRKALGVL